MVTDSRLEPGPGPARLIEHRGVRDLELGEREGPLEPGRPIMGTEGIGHDSHHADQEPAQMAGTEAGADAVGDGGVLDAAQPVVEGLEADAGLGQLALGPFVPVGTAPQRIGRIGADLEEGRSPLGVGEVEVPVVGHAGLAAPGDVGMAGAMPDMGVIDVAPPRGGPLLCLADQHQSGPTGRCCLSWWGRAMSSLDSPTLKRTTGTPVLSSSASSSATSRSRLRLSNAGEGMMPPRLSRNFTTPPSYWSPGI